MTKFPLRDDAATHQIRIVVVRSQIGVTCVCQPAGVTFKRAPILSAETAKAAYREHLAAVGAVA